MTKKQIVTLAYKVINYLSSLNALSIKFMPGVVKKSKEMRTLTLIYLILFLTSQLNLTYASELNNNTINSSVNHLTSHSENLNPYNQHLVANTLASINPSVVNPSIDVAQVISSILHSSLDLGSQTASLNIGSLSHGISINVNGHNDTITSQQMVTPAEAVAVSQILATNHQSLILGQAGNAIGGSLNISNLVSTNSLNSINNLELPGNVTLLAGNNLTLKGNLQNYGDIVFNNSSNLQANLILNENSGLISSSGILSITTNALINEGGGIYGATGLNINAPLIYNSGTIEAGLGNINIASLTSLDITGTANSLIEANSGNINLNSAALNLSNGLNLAFGNYLSHELNLNASQGYINASLNNVTGQINSLGDSEHIITQSTDMIIGNSNIKGDPTYDSTGNISIDGAIATSGNNLAIVAGGNIGVTSGSVTSINTTSSSGNGGNLVMIAGVGTNLIGYTNQTSTITPGLGGETSTISVALGSTTGNTGGNIDLSTGNSLGAGNFVIYTNGTGTNSSGGNVTLVAQANGSTGGQINVGNSTNTYEVVTNATGTGTNGNVLMIATGNSGTSIPYNDISAAYITTSTGNGFAGNIALYVANPTTQTVTFDNTGTIGSGQTITANASSLLPGTIIVSNTLQATTNNYANVTLKTGLTSGLGMSAANIYGVNINLITNGADIGASGGGVSVAGTNLTVNTNNAGNVYLGNANDGLTNTLTINSWTGDNFYFTTNYQPITLAGSLTGNSTSGEISIISNSGNVTFENYISANIVNINVTAGSIIENSSTAVITSTGNNLNLSASSSIGTSSQVLLTNSGTISITESTNTSNTYIQNNYTGNQQLYLTYNPGITTLGSFDYSFASNLTINNNIESISTISLSGLSPDNAGIAIGSNLLAATTAIILAASGSGNITEAANNFTTLQTPSLTLYSGTGNIGTSSIPILAYTTGSPTSTVMANTGGNGNVYLEISPQFTIGTITFITSSAGGTFSDIGSGNSIIVDGNIIAPVISLGGNVSVSSNYNISLTLNASVIGSTSVSLYALNSGSIIQSASTDAISAPTVNLITVSNTLPPPPYGSSNIGSNTSPVVVTNVNTALNVGTTGAVYISSPNNVALGNIGASSSMPSTFALTSTGNITSAGASYMVYAGSITLTANGSNGVGTSASYVNVNTASLTVTANAATTSSAYISDAYSSSTGITLGTSNPAITIGANGTLGFDATNNSIIVGAVISASEIDLTASGTITQSASTDTLTASIVNLQTAGANIGASGSPLVIIASSLGVNTTLNGSTAGANAYIYVSNSISPLTIGTLLLPASNVGTGGTYSLIDANSTGSAEIIIGGNVTGNIISLTSNSSSSTTGGIQEASAAAGTLIGAGTASTVILNNTGTNTSPGTEDIGATGSGSTGAILTQTANLTVTNTLGSAYLSNTGAVTLGTSSVSNTTGSYNLTTVPDASGHDSISIANGNISGHNLSLTTSTPGASGTGNIIQSGTGSLQAANQLNLSSAGNIGTSTSPVLVNTIYNNFQAVDNVYVSDASTTSYLSGSNYSGNNASVGNTSAFDFVASSAGSAITVNSAASVTAGVVTLQADASSGSFVVISGPVNGNKSINILSGGAIIDSRLGTSYTTPILNLTSIFSYIGSSSSVLTVNAAQISANANAASQNVYIADTYVGSTSIGSSGAASTFYFITGFNNVLSTVGSDIITAPTVIISGASVSATLSGTSTLTADANSFSSTNGNVNITDTGIGGNLTLTSATVGSNNFSNEGVNTGGTGSYTLSADNTSTAGILTATGSSVSSNTVSLTSTLGSIGETGGTPSAVALVSPYLALSAVKGSVYATDSGNILVTINANSPTASTGTFSLTNNGSILVSANIGSGSATSGTVDLTTAGANVYTINSTTGDYITAGNVDLNTNGADIGSGGSTGQGVNVDTANLTVSTLNNSSTTGSAYINDAATSTVNLGLAPVSGTNVANISVGASGTLSLTASVANINVANSVIVGTATGTGTIYLKSDTTTGTGSSAGIVGGAGNSLTSGNISLNTNGSDISNSSQTVDVNTTNLSVSTLNNGSTTGSAYINDSAISTINLGGSGTVINVGASGTFSLLAIVANINIAGNVSVGTATGTGTIDLTSGSGSIIGGAGNILTAGNINLNTNGGDIGSGGSTGQGINVDTANLTVSTLNNGSTAGSAYINDAATSTVNLGLAPVSGTNVANISVASSGTLSLTATVANINVAGNVSVGTSTGSGTIDLTSNTTTGSGSNGGIINGANNNLTAGTINLNTSGSDIGSAATGLVVNTSNISLNTTNNSSTAGSAFVIDNSVTAVNLGTSVNGVNLGQAGVLNFYASASINLGSNINAGLSNGTGSILIYARANSGTGINLSSATNNIITSGFVNLLTNGSDIGALKGSSNQNILINTNNLTLSTVNNSPLTGSAYITDSASGNINLGFNNSIGDTNLSVGSSGTLNIYAPNGSLLITAQLNAGTSTGSGAINLTTNNTSSIEAPALSNNVLTAGSINLTTLNVGTFGTGNSLITPIDIDSNKFDITATNAYLSNSINSTINLGSSNVVVNMPNTGIFALIAANSSINVQSSFSLGTSTSTSTIDLIVSGTNSITQSSSNNLLTAGTINLTASSTNIGSSATNMFTIDSSNLSANTTGSGYIQDNAVTSNILASSLGSNLTLNTAGTVNTNGTVTAGTIILNTANNGYINVNANLGQSNSSVSLNANNNGYITTGAHGVIIANSLSLVSPNGEIGFNGQGLITQANNVVFSANLSVGINNTSSSLNIGASGSGANLYVFNSGNITATGLISAPVLGLYSFAGTSGVGSANSLIQISAHNVAFETLNNQGSVYINDTYNGNVTIQNSQVGNVFKLDTVSGVLLLGLIDQNNVISQGQISGSIIAIATSGGFGILSASPLNSNDFIFLTASQNGYIAQQSGYQGSTSIMTAPNVALVSGGGAIGGANNAALLVNSGLVAASTLGAGSFVNITDSASQSGIVGGQSGSSFTFNASNNLNILGSIATGAGTNANGGSINLNANGIVNVGTASAINLTTNNGSIVVQNNDSSSGAINIAKGDFIYGKSIDPTLGYVVFNIGSFSQTNTTNPNPGNITVQTSGSGKVYFGSHGITAQASGNVLNAQGQSITFNTGSLSASAITLGGNDKLTADPVINNTTNTTLKPINSEELNGKTALFMPIAFRQSAEIVNNTSQSYVIKASQNLEFKVLNNTVKLKAGAIVLIAANSNTVSIYNLHDKVNGSVKVNITNNQEYVIKPGSQLTVALNNPELNSKYGNTFANINMLEKIGYRGVKQERINNINIFKSDYSIISAISALKPLKTMAKANDSNMRKAYNDILKTATVVNQTTIYKGLYERQIKLGSKFLSSL